jgi:5'-nucleotidase
MAVYNSGSIRIDDVVLPGPVTQYDVIRMLPFGGEILSVDLSGEMLIRLLGGGNGLRGEGGYLHPSPNTERTSAGWQIDGRPIDPGATYRIATNDYLASGRQPGLEFFTLDDPSISKIGDHGDVRQALIKELQRQFPTQ